MCRGLPRTCLTDGDKTKISPGRNFPFLTRSMIIAATSSAMSNGLPTIYFTRASGIFRRDMEKKSRRQHQHFQ